jgi:hypothetical protein
MMARAKESAGDVDGAIASYGQVTQRSRFWGQATYLMGLLQVERGNLKEGEGLFCKVADPKRSDKSTPVFADEHFFAVRDLARLGLGRIAHEQFRNDDARYYYYLVPHDSDRLSEALYEAATTRYEKKDYDGARELLDELVGLGVHHPYEDETWVLDAYIDLARCKFEDADTKLVEFVRRYEPVRNAARRVAGNESAMQRLLEATRAGSDAGGAESGGASVDPESMRAIAALVRIDPKYGEVVRKRAVLEREASGLRYTLGAIGDLQKTLASNGGLRPAVEEGSDPAQKALDAKAGIDGLARQMDDLQAAQAPESTLAPLREEVTRLQQRASEAGAASAAAGLSAETAGKDLPDLLRADATLGADLQARIETARKQLRDVELALAKDTLERLDRRLSRLLRRARLGRIESIIGRKRALEVEIEAINNGYLPQGAFDSLDAARFLQDNEEYWPFEGDDWWDEFVGGESR